MGLGVWAALIGLLLPLFHGSSHAQQKNRELIIRAGHLFDGKHEPSANIDVEIRDGKIAAVRPATGIADIDLGSRMLAPGLIDTHVHLDWYITAQSRLRRKDDGEDERTAIINAAGNAWRMLQAGFTTVQSVGSPNDKYVRDAINRGVIPGPRVLTSMGQIFPVEDKRTGLWAYLSWLPGSGSRANSAQAIRAAVRKLHSNGADVIKIFAEANRTRGGALTMTEAQLKDACDEAKSLGLRSIVHANRAEDMKRAVRAGCSQVDHGVLADDEALAMMASAGVYFEPQCSLVFQNYLMNWKWFEGLGSWNEKQRNAMQRLVENRRNRGTRWFAFDSLKLVYGSDSVAGAHGQNAADLVCRTRDLGQSAVDALRSATSIAAESLGLADSIGRIAPSYEADLMAFDGDPRADPDIFLRAAFVMKAGVIYRQPPDRAGPDRTFPKR